MKNEEEYLHNVVGIYIHAQMLINHISCIKGSSSTTNSHDKICVQQDGRCRENPN